MKTAEAKLEREGELRLARIVALDGDDVVPFHDEHLMECGLVYVGGDGHAYPTTKGRAYQSRYIPTVNPVTTTMEGVFDNGVAVVVFSATTTLRQAVVWLRAVEYEIDGTEAPCFVHGRTEQWRIHRIEYRRGGHGNLVITQRVSCNAPLGFR